MGAGRRREMLGGCTNRVVVSPVVHGKARRAATHDARAQLGRHGASRCLARGSRSAGRTGEARATTREQTRPTDGAASTRRQTSVADREDGPVGVPARAGVPRTRLSSAACFVQGGRLRDFLRRDGRKTRKTIRCDRCRAQLESLGADYTPDGEMDLDGVFDDDSDARNMLKELEGSTVEDVTMRARLLENEIRVLRDESNRLALDLQSDKEKVKENMEKIKMNKQLPYLVGNVVEILDLKPEVRAPTPPRLAAVGSPPRRAQTHQI